MNETIHNETPYQPIKEQARSFEELGRSRWHRPESLLQIIHPSTSRLIACCIDREVELAFDLANEFLFALHEVLPARRRLSPPKLHPSMRRRPCWCFNDACLQLFKIAPPIPHDVIAARVRTWKVHQVTDWWAQAFYPLKLFDGMNQGFFSVTSALLQRFSSTR